jgi:D-3-phosphoglycerate dehydrogenase
VRAPRILIAESERFSPEAIQILGEVGTVILADLSYEGLRNALPDVDVLWVRLRTRIDAPLIASAARLKVLVTATTGLTHVDTNALIEHGIHLLSLKGETDFLKNVRATAEMTIALMISLIRHIPAAVLDVKAGHWRRDRFEGSELYGRTVGVIGYGRLGALVCRYLRAFEAKVLVYDPKLPAVDEDGDIHAASLDYVLENSDIVTVHADLNEENCGFLTADLLRKMKIDSYFVNTARGELVDEEALLEALKAGQIAGAALDVLCGENSAGMASNALVRYAAAHSNLIITPHLGGCTKESKSKTELFLAAKLRDFLQSLSPSNELVETSSFS